MIVELNYPASDSFVTSNNYICENERNRIVLTKIDKHHLKESNCFIISMLIDCAYDQQRIKMVKIFEQLLSKIILFYFEM